jgi:acetolactate synthase small subunit
MEVWETAKEHSTKELRKKKTEIENLEGALQELVRQYQHLKSKVHILPCLLFRIFPRELIWISSHATSATFTLAVDIASHFEFKVTDIIHIACGRKVLKNLPCVFH